MDGQYETTVSVWIREHLDPDQMVVDQNSLAPRAKPAGERLRSWTMYYLYNARAKTILVPAGLPVSRNLSMAVSSAVDADGLRVHYTPPADFVGGDSFTYTVDDFMTETVNVEVIRRVRDDQFRVDAEDGPQVLPVLINDLFGADYTGTGQITEVTPPSAGGTVTIAHDGQSIVYAPPVNFFGTDHNSPTLLMGHLRQK